MEVTKYDKYKDWYKQNKGSSLARSIHAIFCRTKKPITVYQVDTKDV